MHAPQVVVPFSTFSEASLRLRGGVPNTVVRGGSEGGYRDAAPLATLAFDGPPAEVNFEGNRVEVDFHATLLGGLFGLCTLGAEIALSPQLPWRIRITGGVEHLTMDLSSVALRSFDMKGGMRASKLVLPRPVGTVQVEITGGVSEIEIVRPAGVPLSFELHGGGSQLRIDDLALGAVGRVAWQTPSFDEAADRYLVKIRGGASRATIAVAPEVDQAFPREVAV